MGDPHLPSAVLRLPFVYGPGDKKHRLSPYLRRMDDHRPAILIDRGQLNWRWTRGFVENVGAAISWAVGDKGSARRIYNVGETKGLTEKEWIGTIAQEVGWTGKVLALDKAQLPAQMRSDLAWQHHLATDTSLIRREIGFSEPVSFREGLARTIAWERTNPPADVDSNDFDYESEDRALASLDRGSG
jgi:nucleoside-diphosphate-sugar epimerase